jgi:acetyl-CoA acetyltransferase
MIAGIGESAVSPPKSGRAPESMTIEAVLAACTDAGIEPAELDAIVKYSYDASMSAMSLAATLGFRELSFAMDVPHGGGSSVALIDIADTLVKAGKARAVLCFRTIVGDEFQGQLQTPDPLRPYYLDGVNYLRPVGWTSYLHLFAAQYQEHARRNGLGRETLFQNANLMRKNAAMARHAISTHRLSREEYFGAPRTVGPFTKFDEYAPADASCAVVVTATSNATGSRPAVEVMSSAQSHGPDPKTWFDLRPLSTSYPDSPATFVASKIFKESGLSPAQIDVAELYDCTTFTSLDLLTQYGLVAMNELVAVVSAGELAVGGRIPMNTHGGDYAGGYTHGFRHVLEAVKQLRGDADNQVPDAEFALVAAPQIGPTSGAILRRMS